VLHDLRLEAVNLGQKERLLEIGLSGEVPFGVGRQIRPVQFRTDRREKT
jgi:hypothetical protein